MIKLPQIPGYRLIRKLGHGGMADVYLGVQENLQREVAIKVLVSSLFRDEQFSLRFIKEAQTAARLSHPNIITIHDIGQVGETYFIVMEYLHESLNDRIKKVGLVPPREALDIVKRIASALDYAHNKGFIHRDIKPDNIMFRSDGTAVLVDFGIARAIDSTTRLTRTGMSIGTPYYMSPEQCRGEKIDGRSDIYALGVQFFELLTGKVPYKAENTAGIILKHIQDPVPRLPLELCQYQPLLDKMMAKDKEMRISCAAELVKFIEGFLIARDHQLPPPMPTMPAASVARPEMPTAEQLTIPTPRPAASISFRKQPGRKKWLAPALLGLAAAMVVGTSIYFFSQSTPGKTENSSPKVEQKVETVTETLTGKETVSSTPTGTDKTQQPLAAAEKKNNSITPTARDAGADADAAEKPGKSTKSLMSDKSDKSDRSDKSDKSEAVKEPLPKVEQTPAPSPFQQIKTATLLDLHPDVLREYSAMLERLQIPVLNPKLKIIGQIVVNLAIDENGKITIQNFQDMIKVTPLLQETQVKIAIARKINGISLPPPKNKNGEPVKVSNWRVTFKVGKFLNNIILTKQN
ncbi:MAG: serine/threonine-protein kinase [Candidatus Aminicenantes bacterium]|nr:serine/threonine-protein kinase [Candidatus Aminicenantes bacterium]